MDLVTSDLRAALVANGIASAASDGAHDPVPVVKLFNPLGAATWLVTELDADGDTLFGLADLGFGCPELGSFSLSEIAALRLPLGLGIERDLCFSTATPLSVWADTARRAGSIIGAAQILQTIEAYRRAARIAEPQRPSGASHPLSPDPLPSTDPGDG